MSPGFVRREIGAGSQALSQDLAQMGFADPAPHRIYRLCLGSLLVAVMPSGPVHIRREGSGCNGANNNVVGDELNSHASS